MTFQTPEQSPGGRYETEKGPPWDVLGQTIVSGGQFKEGELFGALHRVKPETDKFDEITAAKQKTNLEMREENVDQDG